MVGGERGGREDDERAPRTPRCPTPIGWSRPMAERAGKYIFSNQRRRQSRPPTHPAPTQEVFTSPPTLNQQCRGRRTSTPTSWALAPSPRPLLSVTMVVAGLPRLVSRSALMRPRPSSLPSAYVPPSHLSSINGGALLSHCTVVTKPELPLYSRPTLSAPTV